MKWLWLCECGCFEGCLELFKKCDLDHDCEKVHLDQKINIKELSAK